MRIGSSEGGGCWGERVWSSEVGVIGERENRGRRENGVVGGWGGGRMESRGE